MGLLTKNKPNSYGFKTDYWKISKINIDLDKKNCDIRFSGYISQEASELKFEPVEIKIVRANFDEFIQYLSSDYINNDNKNIYKACYEYAKIKEPVFNSAKDC